MGFAGWVLLAGLACQPPATADTGGHCLADCGWDPVVAVAPPPLLVYSSGACRLDPVEGVSSVDGVDCPIADETLDPPRAETIVHADARNDQACAVFSGGTLECTTSGAQLLRCGDVVAVYYANVSLAVLTPCGELEVCSVGACEWHGVPDGLRSLDVSGYETCIVREAGSLDCFRNFETGVMSLPGPYVEVQVPSDAGGCARGEAAGVDCWGVIYPARKGQPPSGRVIAMAVEDIFACALDEAGSVGCWGAWRAEWGETGRWPSGPFVAIVSSNENVCALAADGSGTCWSMTDPYLEPDPLPSGIAWWSPEGYR